jgi:GNAT superfamily N-acetyltransferase
MILTKDAGLDPYIVGLQELCGECFDCGDFSPADYRFLKSVGRSVIAHSAIVKRDFDLDIPSNITTYLLGYVGVTKTHRLQGLGKRAVQEIMWALCDQNYALVLNCSEKNRPFYERLGFRLISDKSTFIRNNKLVVDLDPVMIFFKNPKKDSTGHYDSIHFGEEF